MFFFIKEKPRKKKQEEEGSLFLDKPFFFFKKMFRFSIAALQLLELFVSSVVHLLYGGYIFSSAVAGDLSLALNDLFFKSNIEGTITDNNRVLANSDHNDLPPIVLVHGIFGFGKGVFSSFSYLVFVGYLLVYVYLH